MNELPAQRRGLVNGVIRFCLEQKLVVAIVTIAVIFWGVLVAPFDWQIEGVPRSPVPVDAIPDIGENQQIVFTEWPGRSPQDIDDQISYPLTVALLGIPGVKDIRSYSIFGFSTIYVVFDDDIEFYWSRSRVLEKLNSLPAGTLPTGITPMLGPDATALGQVFWYTLEGRDPDGNPTGGWGPDELRSLQDFTVKYKLAGVEGVSEVASIGGFVREYQVDVNPDAMRAADVTLQQVIGAVRKSNMDVGARTLEVNRAEYVVRGLGFIKDVKDLEQTAITARNGQPILIDDIATVSLGPALRRGVLTKAGEEAVGGVVVVRYGENPMATIQRVKAKINDIASGLPSKVLADGRSTTSHRASPPRCSRMERRAESRSCRFMTGRV
jgi:Cu(I)/Ag(I) efflux system membrane protein CusA/SilA